MNIHPRLAGWCAALLGLLALVIAPAIIAAQPPAPTASRQTIYLPLVADGALPAPGGPLNVRAHRDAGRSAGAAIGPEGGTIAATAASGTRIELRIPPDALDWTETITITPIGAIDGLPLSGGLLGAADIEPAGLRLNVPATLTITPAQPPAGPLAVGFAFDGAGSEFHLAPLAGGPPALSAEAREIRITMEIIAIRPVGAGSGTRADIDAQAPRAPIDPTDALDQRLVESAIDRNLQRAFLRQHLEGYVKPLVDQAVANPARVDAAMSAYLDWEARVNQTGNADLLLLAALLWEDLGRAIATDGARASERCYSQKRPEEGFRLLRYAGYARKLMRADLSAAMIAKLKKCLVFSVRVYSLITEGGFGDPYGYRYELETNLTLRWKSRTRVTGSAPLVALDMRWIGSGDCTSSMALTPTTFDAESGEFGLSIAPVSRTSPDVNVRFAYSPGAPREQTTLLCNGVPPIRGDTSAWISYYTEMHDYERDGAGFTARSQAAGMRNFAGWTYSHTTVGPGGQQVRETSEIDVVHTPER